MTLEKIEHLSDILHSYLQGENTPLLGYALMEILGPGADTSKVWMAQAKLENEKLKINSGFYETAGI